MNTYDELYDDIKRAVNEGYELRFEKGRLVDWNCGAYYAYRYVLDKLEEIREAEEHQSKSETKSEVTITTLLDKIENLERALSEMQSQGSEIYLALCEMELNAKKGRMGFF